MLVFPFKNIYLIPQLIVLLQIVEEDHDTGLCNGTVRHPRLNSSGLCRALTSITCTYGEMAALCGNTCCSYKIFKLNVII